MKRKQLKFVVGSAVIIVAIAFLAYSGYQDSKSYFQTVPEVSKRRLNPFLHLGIWLISNF